MFLSYGILQQFPARLGGTTPGPAYFTDDFESYTSGELLEDQDNWALGIGSGMLTCNGTAIYPNSNVSSLVYYDTEVTANQKSILLISRTSTSRAIGPAVRISGGDG